MVNSLNEILAMRASEEPHRLAYRFLMDSDQDEIILSYSELHESAGRIAGRLLREMKPGDRALLLYPPGLDFIEAYFGCLYAGIIAVPAYPPHPARLARTLPMIQSIVRDASPAAALITSSLHSAIKLCDAGVSSLPGLKWIETDGNESFTDDYQHALIDPNDTAFLQYTSGSSGNPKGVMVSHNNLLHNLEYIHKNFDLCRDSNVVSWLPPYHDMGLIGNILQSLYSGFPLTLMSHLAFLQRPIRWLEAISDLKADVSGGPNFAYDLCLRKIRPEQRDSIDLSKWNIAFCGAETVHYETMDRFAKYFAPCGFKREAFRPCYGMAEATLMITGVPRGKKVQHQSIQIEELQQNRIGISEKYAARTQRVVSCGESSSDQEVIVVDPESRSVCPANTVGEIWLRGSSVAKGYWNKPDETKQIFKAQLMGSENKYYLTTGDLGFLLNNELYITGRIKDLIISGGNNHYPVDIERTIKCVCEEFGNVVSVAFSISQGQEEQLVILVEVDSKQLQRTEELRKAIVHGVSDRHELPIHDIKFVSVGSIFRTSSGKLKRYLCKARYLEGYYQAITQI